MSSSSTRGWVVTFCGMGINLALGVLYTWSVFAAALIENLGWSKSQASLPYMVACAVFALIMVPAGRLVDRWGPRWVAALGGIFCGAGLLIMGLTHSLGMSILAFGVITGIGIGLGYAAPSPAAVKWFPPEKRGLITGLVVAGFGLASIYIAPMTHYFIGTYGVQRAFFIEGIIFIVAILILSQVLAFPPVEHDLTSTKLSEKNIVVSSKHDYSPQEMLATAQFWLLWVMYAFAAAAGLMIIGHLAKIANVQAHVSWGYLMVAVLAIFNAGGRIIAGFVSDWIGRINMMRLVFALQVLNMLAFTKYDTGGLVLLGACIAGLCYGALLSVFPSTTWDYFGLKNAGVNYGIVFTAWGAGGILGPIIAGMVADITKAYTGAYLIAAVLLLIAICLTFVIKPPKSKLT